MGCGQSYVHGLWAELRAWAVGRARAWAVAGLSEHGSTIRARQGCPSTMGLFERIPIRPVPRSPRRTLGWRIMVSSMISRLMPATALALLRRSFFRILITTRFPSSSLAYACRCGSRGHVWRGDVEMQTHARGAGFTAPGTVVSECGAAACAASQARGG